MQDFKLPDIPDLPRNLPDLPDFTQQTTEPAYKPRPYVKPAKQEPKPKEAETLGFITNIPKSVLNMTKGLFVDLPVAVGSSVYNYSKNPSQYVKDWNLMFSGNSGLADLAWHELSDYYAKDFWYNFNEDPGRFLQDAASLASGVGLIGKGSKIGSVATKAGEWIDPLSATFKLTGKALAKPLEAIGIGDETQALERIARTRAGKEALESAAATKQQLFGKLTPEESERLRRLIILGEPDEIATALAKNDNVAKRYQLWSDRISKTEEPFWKAQVLLDDNEMVEANAKAIEMYTTYDPKWAANNIPISKDQAKQMILDGSLKPSYMSMFRLKNQALDLYDALNEFGSGNRGILGRLEKRLARGEYLTDVDEIMARQIHSFHQAKYKISLLDEVKQYLVSKQKLLLARTPEEAEKAISQGYRRLDDAFARNYWESYNRATQIQVEAVKRAAATGENTATALLKAKEAFDKLEAAGKVERLLDRAEIYVPAHVAAWLNRELAPISKGWQMYDKWMSRFKSAVTVFNPRYWSSVVFGNALLATMYGLSPDMARIAWKHRGDMPVALRQLASHEIFLKDRGIYDRVARSFGEAAGRLDELAKSGIFVSEIAKVAAKNFYISQMDLIAAVKFYAEAPELLAKARTEVMQLQAQAAAALVKRDSSYRTLKQKEKRLEFEIAKLMELRQISAAELSTAIEARADALGKALNHVTVTAPKYTYFAQQFVEEIKNLTSKLRNSPEIVDNAGVVSAIDTGLHFVAMGKPELLRHAVKRLKKAVRGDSVLVQRERRLSVFVDMVGKAEERVKIATANFLDRSSQAGTLSRSVPELERAAAVADKAIDTANRFYGSYTSLLPFERQVLRRVVPFYTFTKAMTKLAFQFPFLYPKRTFIITHLAKAWNDVMHDENAFMPSWSKNYIPVGATEDGGVIMVRVGSFTPLANVRMTGFGGHEIPSIADLAGQHPFIRVAFEMKGGIPDWTKRPLSPGDRAVRLDNGEVVEFSGDGFKTVIAQPSVWKSLFGMFPQSQLIHSVLSKYAQTDRGWLFNPDPIQTPYGKPRYPKELSDIVLSYTLAPTTRVRPEELERRERVYAGLVAREFQREIKTASPERRNDLIQALRSWQTQRKQAVER